MAATASLEDLQRFESDIREFKIKHPQAFEDMRILITENRKIGYRNICKLILGDTPEKLKE